MTDVCLRAADNGADMVLQTKIDLPACAGATAGGGPTLGAVRFNDAAPSQAYIGVVRNLGVTGTACSAPQAGGPSPFGVDMTLNFVAGPPSWRHLWAPPPVTAVPTAVSGMFVPVQVVRYAVATDPNDPSNPNDPNFLHLWRSVTGGRSAGDGWANPQAIPGPEWQLVARGINDLQVSYVDATGLLDEPQQITAITQWDRLVRQVNVTLSSRVAGMNIAGFTGQDGSDAAQIRLGQLTSQVAPRSTLLALQEADDPNEWK